MNLTGHAKIKPALKKAGMCTIHNVTTYPFFRRQQCFKTGRFPDLGSLLSCTFPFPRKQWLFTAERSPLQWRDRSGFSPDSLLSIVAPDLIIINLINLILHYKEISFFLNKFICN